MSFDHTRILQQVKKNGFSLLEVLITAAIIGIVTAIVIIKYGAFNSSVLLRNHAYEIALSIRQAQVFSVSTRRDDAVDSGSFRNRYGVYIDISGGSAQELTVFLDLSGNGRYDGEPTDKVIETLVLDSRFEITNLCIDSGCRNPTHTIDDISITFVRPIFEPEFVATKSGVLVSGTISSSEIELAAVTDNTIKREVVVSSTGLISVQ